MYTYVLLSMGLWYIDSDAYTNILVYHYGGRSKHYLKLSNK